MSAQGMTETVLITTLAAALKADGADEHVNWRGPALREWIKGLAAGLSAQAPQLMEMRCAIVESGSGAGRHELRFLFGSSSEMHRAINEWQEFNK